MAFFVHIVSITSSWKEIFLVVEEYAGVNKSFICTNAMFRNSECFVHFFLTMCAYAELQCKNKHKHLDFPIIDYMFDENNDSPNLLFFGTYLPNFVHIF